MTDTEFTVVFFSVVAVIVTVFLMICAWLDARSVRRVRELGAIRAAQRDRLLRDALSARIATDVREEAARLARLPQGEMRPARLPQGEMRPTRKPVGRDARGRFVKAA